MENPVDTDEKIIRVVDILEQIKNLNAMIELQKRNKFSDSGLRQYQYMRSEFIKELSEILANYQIQIKAA